MGSSCSSVPDGIHCRGSAGTGPVILKVVLVTGAAFAVIPIRAHQCAPLISYTTSGRKRASNIPDAVRNIVHESGRK